jgi:hypothetical protein
VDETRELERVAAWDDPAQFAWSVSRQYRRDFWAQQPVRVEVWSEKGTVRGVLQPVLNEYAVGFRVMHGYAGATTVYNVAQDYDGRDLIALYLGDHDPSGRYMSDADLPVRIEEYGGHHVYLQRIALRDDDLAVLPSFDVGSKKKDPRYSWFRERFGPQCYELDAMDPGALRRRVQDEIACQIDWTTWNRCAVVNDAERESLQEVLSRWGAAA